MNMDEYTKINHKRHSHYNNSNHKFFKYIKFLITRILLSIILIISTLILIRIDENNKIYLDKYVFRDSLEFTKINKWYQDKFGKLLPNIDTDSNLVFGDNDLTTNNYENYEDGIKIKLDKGSPVSCIYGGLVVYIGEKEKYGNTLVVQGNDGINYYYGNIINTSVNIFDYIEKNTLIGETKDEWLYLLLEKDGKYLDYEEYLKQN